MLELDISKCWLSWNKPCGHTSKWLHSYFKKNQTNNWLNIAYNNCDTTAHKSRTRIYSLCDRYTIIIHTKFRHKCPLNSDLFRCNILTVLFDHVVKLKTPITIFFVTCTQYSALRNDIFNETVRTENFNIVNTHILWGDCSHNNKHLFSLVHRYIKSSERFNYDNG